jgi:hypothetical protein
VRNITKGEEIAFYNFSEPNSWEQGAYGDATLRVVDGVYRVEVFTGDGTLWWGQWGDIYTDTVIDVDAAQITERNENTYGVMCRVRGTLGQAQAVDPTLAAMMLDVREGIDAEATDFADSATDEPSEDDAEATTEATTEATAESTPESTTEAAAEATEDAPRVEGDGYLFLVQGTGGYAIMRARGRDVVPLVDWGTSDAITQGPGENHIRAVCAGDYLALYVNDQLLAETNDDTYTQGQIGLVASAVNRLGVRVEFDNLQISEAVAN